jgi:photosystem II stability/assembly factor-like uncharacterized protein
MLLAVGDAGTLLRSRDGQSWTPITNLPAPMAAANLRGVFLRTPAVGFVVGDGGLIARTLDAGSTWTVIRTNVTADLYTVAAVPTALGDEVWAAGAHQAVLFSPDNGGTWTTLPAPVAGTTVPDFIYRAVQPVEPGHVFLAGEQGHLLEKIPGFGEWVERDPGTNDTYYALRMPDASRGMAVSADKAGTPRVSFTLEGWLKSFNAALPAGTPRLLGGDVLGSDTVVVGESGTILRTGGAFTSGARYRSETPAIRAVVSPRAGEYIAAGDTGLLLRSADNGATWDEIPFQNPFGLTCSSGRWPSRRRTPPVCRWAISPGRCPAAVCPSSSARWIPASHGTSSRRT